MRRAIDQAEPTTGDPPIMLKELPNDDRSRLARIGATGADAPVTLKEACEDLFKGAVTVATLMAEHRRENLVIFKIGRQYFTTYNELIAMIEKCRVQASRRHAPQAETEARRYNEAALAAARLSAARLKESSRKRGRVGLGGSKS